MNVRLHMPKAYDIFRGGLQKSENEVLKHKCRTPSENVAEIADTIIIMFVTLTVPVRLYPA